MREQLRDTERLQHILTAADDIAEFTDGASFDDFAKNKMMKHAVYRNFAIIGEAANLLTKEYKAANPVVEWTKIIGMRHVLVHGYYEADDNVVWQAITADLPVLRCQIELMLNK